VVQSQPGQTVQAYYLEKTHHNFKAMEANRRREPGTREKVSSRRINLEDNTCTGKQCRSTPCIAILISTSKNPWSFLLLLILSVQ
jgi:hypothetical protein